MNITFKTLVLTALFAASATAATVQTALKTPSLRTPAPPFRLADASGQTRELAAYRGKVVVLNFWATECGGCRLEIPWLVDIDRAFQKKSVAVIGVSTDISYEDLKSAAEAWSKVKPFVAAQRISYPILMENDEVTKRYDIQALPVTYLIDAQGRIAATYVGLIDENNVKTNINALVNERSGR